MTDTPLPLGSLWFLIGVAFEGVSREHPEADGKTLLSLALAETIRSWLAAGDEQVLRWLLAEMADALDNPNAELRLTLRSSRRGPIVSPTSRLDQKSEAYSLAKFVWKEWQESQQMESAVAAAVERYRLSRTTVFERIKEAAREVAEERRRYAATAEQIADMAANPESYSRIVTIDDESDSFDNWLDRYLDEPPADEG